MQSPLPVSIAASEQTIPVTNDAPQTSPWLADAFGEFIATSARLEQSFHALQTEVVALRREREERARELEASLIENRQMRLTLEQMINGMPCGVLVIDPSGAVRFANPEARLLLGLGAGLAHPELSACIAEVVPASLFCYSTAHDHEFECEMRLAVEGRDRWLQIRRRILPLRDACVEAQFLLLLRDVSAAHLADRDREAGRNALAQSEISSVLAHEIRNPLASLELFAELIERDEVRRGEWVANLRAGLRSLAGTVNNVLAFYGRAAWRELPVRLPALLHEAADFLRPLAQQANVRVHVNSASVDVTVMGNADALRQLLLNLLTNAIRYTPEGGVATLSLDVSEEVLTDNRDRLQRQARLRCEDTGPGIAEPLLDRIFEPGFSAGGVSSGLSLAVCRQIAARHQGRITAGNVHGGGAYIELKLPLCGAMEAA